jgi:hypothetical protein
MHLFARRWLLSSCLFARSLTTYIDEQAYLVCKARRNTYFICLASDASCLVVDLSARDYTT